jgi:hypothetical protein
MTDEGMTDTDDGLMSYTLPNLPVYMSDAEGEGSDGGEYQAPTQQQQQQQQPLQSSTNPTYPQQQQEMYAYAQQQQQLQQQYGGYPRGQYPPPPHDPQLQQPPPYMGYQSAGYAPYPPNMPYSGYDQQQQYSQQQQLQQQQMTPQQQQQHQQMLASQYAAAWGHYPRPSLRTPPSHAQAATRVAPTAANQATLGPATFQQEQQRHQQQQQQQQQLVVQPEVVRIHQTSINRRHTYHIFSHICSLHL